MRNATNPDHATERLDELRRYQILDTESELAYDDLVQLASYICETPIALISLVDADRQWFKARVGLETQETPIEQSFCAHAIAHSGLFIVPDAQADPRFAHNELVTGDPRIRFYAGAPLTTSQGYALGTICVIDVEPRELAPAQLQALEALSRQTIAQMELKLRVTELKKSKEALGVAHDGLERRVAERTAELEQANRGLQAEIARRKAAESSLQFQATHDELTGLANRSLLYEHLRRSMNECPPDQSLALLLLDLDRFKEINDAFGHGYGDDVLRRLSPRLRKALGEAALIARLGGDEFAVVLKDTDEADALRMAGRVVECLARPMEVEGHRLDVRASIGIALYPNHGLDPASLLQRADVAMYAAKRSEDEFAIYDEGQPHANLGRLEMITSLRDGIAGGEMILNYQRKVHLATMSSAGAEALVRWRHPVRGLIPPGEFIPLAEQTGLIRRLDLWTLDAATRQMQEWRTKGSDLAVAVNLGAESLRQSDLASLVSQVLEETGTPPQRLTLEITESSMMADPDLAQRVLNQIHEIGVRISIDDFGTGYSSLAYLRGLPVDEIKVDQSFIKNMSLDASDACIVRSVIDLGHNLGMRVVGEGIEDGRTADLLASMGCDFAQGFYFGRPLSPDEFVVKTEVRARQAAGDRPWGRVSKSLNGHPRRNSHLA